MKLSREQERKQLEGDGSGSWMVVDIGHDIREMEGELNQEKYLIGSNLLIFPRHLAIVGRSGHVATFDWQTGALHAELQLQETCRDITYVLYHLFPELSHTYSAVDFYMINHISLWHRKNMYSSTIEMVLSFIA